VLIELLFGHPRLFLLGFQHTIAGFGSFLGRCGKSPKFKTRKSQQNNRSVTVAGIFFSLTFRLRSSEKIKNENQDGSSDGC